MIQNRQYKILETLVNNQNDYITGDSLSQILSYSKRTVQNDIRVLKDELEQHKASIESFGGKGYQLRIENEKAFYDYYNDVRSSIYLNDSKEGRMILILISVAVMNRFSDEEVVTL